MNFRLEVSVAALATAEKEEAAIMGVLRSKDRRALSLTCWLPVWGACYAEAAEMSNVARRALAADIVRNTLPHYRSRFSVIHDGWLGVEECLISTRSGRGCIS